ncbi:hypothetical protein GCM10010172_44730 [Paractinoplanes ferrugineus]|uniref:Uncharacterized protein n=1 Tax=Paractinoplanes ferrugineus TaxID=113564 RepID=A0A919J0N2_9ACTN|nr:hypothetical protein [Actinoplanes ferrugineus]GIE11212.1 hypothetical protein Afe05nite_30520 [Actinoplanes ferrugineus]
MSLNSLRSLTNAASLATAAFDTARTTLKAMAEAAAATAPADETTGKETTSKSAAAEAAPAAAEPVRADTEAKKPRGIRKGVELDAYA